MKTGIGWYTKESYQKLLDYADDREKLDDTYEDWLANYSRVVKNLRKSGIKAVPVTIEIDELMNWCSANNLPNTGESRSKFVSVTVMKKYE